MIDYYETKQHPVTKKMVLDAYKKVRENKGSAGVDEQSLEDFKLKTSANLYKIWNRMTSGSYYPNAVKQVLIPKKSGGTRSLGVPTVCDRIAQQVVKSYLEAKVEASFHQDSYGYRPNKSAHQALDVAKGRCSYYSWVLDIDIKGFFDNIDHELMLKALKWYTQEKWILNYVERWLKAGVFNGNEIESREKGTPQGGVISPLLANIFLHFAFDMWMLKRYPHVPFERYCDDVIIHCSGKEQALMMKMAIAKRMKECKLELNEQKTQIVYCRNQIHKEKYEQVSFDFLGYTFKPRYCPTKKGLSLLFTPCMSTHSKNDVREKIRKLINRSFKGSVQQLAQMLNQKVRGWFQYYCQYNKYTTIDLWYWLNGKVINWVMKNRHFGKRRAVRWLKTIYSTNPDMFIHWQLSHPW